LYATVSTATSKKLSAEMKAQLNQIVSTLRNIIKQHADASSSQTALELPLMKPSEETVEKDPGPEDNSFEGLVCKQGGDEMGFVKEVLRCVLEVGLKLRSAQFQGCPEKKRGGESRGLQEPTGDLLSSSWHSTFLFPSHKALHNNMQ
jgi:hypothetical protein